MGDQVISRSLCTQCDGTQKNAKINPNLPVFKSDTPVFEPSKIMHQISKAGVHEVELVENFII
jgi:hypothetical protein